MFLRSYLLSLQCILSLFGAVALRIFLCYQLILVYILERLHCFGDEGSLCTDLEKSRIRDQGVTFFTAEKRDGMVDEPLRPRSQTTEGRTNCSLSAFEHSGRLEIDRNKQDRGFQAFVAATSDKESEQSEDEDEVEKQIASAPRGFGRIINNEDQGSRQESGFPSNGSIALATPRNDIKAVSVSGSFKTAIDKEGFESHRSPSPSDSHVASPLAVSNSSVQSLPRLRKSTHQGRYLYRLKEAGELERLSISPILLDFGKTRDDRSTPTISSHGTEQDRSSPLFPRSFRAILQQSQLEDSPIVGSDLTSAWLLNVRTPSPVEPNKVPSSKSLAVWRDNFSSGSPETSASTRQSNGLLKDVTNFRHPGYLQHNSFFQSAEKARLKKDGELNARQGWMVPSEQLPQHARASSFNVKESDNLAHAGELAGMLPKLEGLMVTDSPSPLKRFSLSERCNDSNVPLCLDDSEFQHPQPVRYSDTPQTLERFERILEEGAGAELDKTVGAGGYLSGGLDSREKSDEIERPFNPTPNQAEFQYGLLEHIGCESKTSHSR